MTNNNRKIIKCEYCGTSYTEKEFENLELTGHNGIWNFDYRRCGECGREIIPFKADIRGKIGEV